MQRRGGSQHGLFDAPLFKVSGGILLVVCLGLGLAFGLAPRRDIATTIRIAAPPSRVWAILVDTQNYPAWNPQMRLQGTLVPGAIIRNQQGPGDAAEVFWPTVLTVKPDQELSWQGRIWLPRLFDAEHYFLLTSANGGTLFTQGEKFRGILLWFFDVRQLLPAFEGMNAALKARAETLNPPQ